MRFPYGATVTIVRELPGGFDQYGDPIPGSTSRTDIPGCGVAPRRSVSDAEPDTRGNQGVIVGKSLYLPNGAPEVLYTDRIEIAGRQYEVEGEPGEWVSPFTGWAPGTEVALKRA